MTFHTWSIARRGGIEIVRAPLEDRRWPARLATAFELTLTRNHVPTRNVVDGRAFDVPTRSLLVVEPGTIWEASGEDAFRSIELPAASYDDWWSETLRARPSFAAPSYAPGSLGDWLERAHRDLFAEADTLAVQERTARILGRVITAYARVTPRPMTHAPPPLLERVRDLLTHAYAEALTLEEIARRTGSRVGSFHLLRSFRRRFGVTPSHYQRLVRLAAAKDDLTRGRPIVESALAAGFFDQAHFTRGFRKVYGVTPGAYVNRVQDAARDVAIPEG